MGHRIGQIIVAVGYYSTPPQEIEKLAGEINTQAEWKMVSAAGEGGKGAQQGSVRAVVGGRWRDGCSAGDRARETVRAAAFGTVPRPVRQPLARGGASRTGIKLGARRMDDCLTGVLEIAVYWG
ncbi:MAG: hypothetical protein KME26_17865 [Oscillatoria princeps RMCB-10]|nr:hypothetical protein [Oscillatoria princeps RMCB-10]